MEERSIQSNLASSNKRGRSDFGDLYFARENSKSNEKSKAADISFGEKELIAILAEKNEKDEDGPYNTSKQNQLYGMTLDKYFGGNFKPLSIGSLTDVSKSGNQSQGIMLLNTSPTSEFSLLFGASSDQTSDHGRELSELNESTKSEFELKNEIKQMRGFNITSIRFESQEKIFEEEGEIETSSYNGSENFAILEEEEDLDLSQGSLGGKKVTQIGGWTQKNKELMKIGEKPSPKLHMNELRPAKAEGRHRQIERIQIDLGIARRNKFMEKRESRLVQSPNTSIISAKSNSSDQEGRENSLKEKIEKKYKIHKKTHTGGFVFQPTLTRVDSGPGNAPLIIQKIVKKPPSSSRTIQIGSKPPQVARNSSSRQFFLNLGTKKNSIDLSKNAFCTTQNTLKQVRNSSARIPNPDLFKKKIHELETFTNFYKPQGNEISILGKNHFAMHGFLEKTKRLKSRRQDINTSDIIKHNFYEKRMENSRKTSISKLKAEKSQNDRYLKREKENFINKYSSKFKFSEKETRALAAKFC